MIRIRRIAVLATATTVAISGGAVVFAVALLMVLSLAVGANGLMVPFGGGGMMLVIAPLFYAAFLWVLTALLCLAYNAAASLTGGIGFTLDRDPAPVSDVAHRGQPD